MGLDDVLEINGQIINNSNTSILDFFPSELVSRIESLVTILKITGIIIIGYIVFLIIKWIFSIRRHRKISKIYRKVYEIDAKLNVLLKRKYIPKINKLEKKEGLINRLFRKENKSLKKVVTQNKKGKNKK